MQDQQAADPSLPLLGRRALVVGGTGGIGFELALALARRGASLVVHGGSSPERLERSLDALRAAAEGLRASPQSPEPPRGFLLPLSRPGELLALLPELGQIDILVCAFGPFVRKALHETSAEDWERLALLDLALPGALASALLPGMAERGWGRFVFFGGSRSDAIRPYKLTAAYAAAKTGLGVLAKSIAVEYAARQVGAFVFCPGLVDTEYLDPELRARLAARAPGGRLHRPAALAELAASLLAAEPCMASGGVFALDGGLDI